MMKKIISLLLIFALLTSCSSSTEDSETAEATSESSTISDSEFDRENTLEVFMVGMPMSWGDEGDY